MRAWRGRPFRPCRTLGRAPAVRIHDTATGGLLDRPRAAGEPARLYVCGITPYDATHLGHAATYVAFDLLNRAWRDAGHEVRYVQNVTDVDDPLLERAAATGRTGAALADREIERFRGDCEALRILPPDEYVGVVESIPLVVDMVEQLHEQGHAYEVDGDWYFSVHADPAFGSVSDLSRRRCSRSSPSAAATPTGPARSTRSTACCGGPSAPASRRGTPRWGRADPGGTSSAARSPSTAWATTSTCRAAAATSPSRTTR